MKFRILNAAVIAAVLGVSACAQQEEVVVVEEVPIYGKDGTIIGTRPMVAPGGHSGSDGMSMDDSDSRNVSRDDDDDDDDG